MDEETARIERMERISGVRAAVRAQPVVARRADALVRQITVGALLGAAGVAAQLMCSRTLLRYQTNSRLRDNTSLWPMVCSASSTLVLVLCLVQWWVWRQARKEWRGVKDVALAGWISPSRAAAWSSGVLAAVNLVAGLMVGRSTSLTEQAHWWSFLGSLLTLSCAALGAIHPFDPAGPRGVSPRLLVRNLNPGSTRHARVAEVDPDVETLVLADPTSDTVVIGPDGVVR